MTTNEFDGDGDSEVASAREVIGPPPPGRHVRLEWGGPLHPERRDVAIIQTDRVSIEHSVKGWGFSSRLKVDGSTRIAFLVFMILGLVASAVLMVFTLTGGIVMASGLILFGLLIHRRL